MDQEDDYQFEALKKNGGTDYLGTTYKNIDEFWQTELGQNEAQKQVVKPVGGYDKWYQNADKYWMVNSPLLFFQKNVEPTINGVLGGLEFLDSIDINGSKEFLSDYFKQYKSNRGRVLDCGAGIGRVTKHLLLNWFNEIDLIDQCAVYIEKAKEELKGSNQVKNFYVGGLQNFTPEMKYDCIWVQWVASHLTDIDLVSFLQRCITHLTKGGFIFLKENVTQQGFVVDKEDFSVTRSLNLFYEIFQKADVRVIMERQQPNFPRELFQVWQFALIAD